MVELLPRTHCVGALNCVFTICRIGKRREGSRGAGGGLRASSQPRGLRPYGASTSPALYCTPCCFNQWQACSQDTENRGYCTVSVGFYCMFVSLSCSENFCTWLYIFYLACGPWYEFASICHAFINILYLVPLHCFSLVFICKHALD